MPSTDSEILSVACLVPYPYDSAPSQRYRWEQWAPGLREHGVELEFIPFATPDIHRGRNAGSTVRPALRALARVPFWAAEVARAPRHDVMVVHRNAMLGGPPIAEMLLARSGTPMVYDFDDAIYTDPTGGSAPLRRLLRSDWRVPALCRRADLVSVGNHFLETWVRPHNPSVVVWPTTISMAAYRQKPPSDPSRRPVLGWTGSGSTAYYVKNLLPLLRKLRQTVDFEMLVVGAEIDLGDLPGRCMPWSSETELASVHAMDVGIMPLDDDEWSRGKCALKALQYLAAGVPAVVSDVGVNRDAVPDGKAGFVVDDEQGWLDRLGRLLSDPQLRLEMGQRGRAHVRAHFSAEAWAPRIAERLRGLAESKRGATELR